MKPLFALLLFLAVTSITQACPACGTSHLVLLGKPSGPQETSAWLKLKTDLSSRFNLFPIDFDGDDSTCIAELPSAKLLVIGSSPTEWPADLVAGVQGYLDRGFPLVVLDDSFENKTSTTESAASLWLKLDLALGCDAALPAPASLFEKAPKPGDHAALSGVPAETMAALTPQNPPCHMLAVIASDETRGPVAWMTAYHAPAPADRFGNVAVIPLPSTTMLASPDVRRLVLQACLAATDSEDLIPAAGMTVIP